MQAWPSHLRRGEILKSNIEVRNRLSNLCSFLALFASLREPTFPGLVPRAKSARSQR
jgi:hypothetical protein